MRRAVCRTPLCATPAVQPRWLFTAWGFLSFVTTAILAAAWHVESALLAAAILVTVLVSPIIVTVFWNLARQRSRQELLAKDG